MRKRDASLAQGKVHPFGQHDIDLKPNGIPPDGHRGGVRERSCATEESRLIVHVKEILRYRRAEYAPFGQDDINQRPDVILRERSYATEESRLISHERDPSLSLRMT